MKAINLCQSVDILSKSAYNKIMVYEPNFYIGEEKVWAKGSFGFF